MSVSAMLSAHSCLCSGRAVTQFQAAKLLVQAVEAEDAARSLSAGNPGRVAGILAAEALFRAGQAALNAAPVAPELGVVDRFNILAEENGECVSAEWSEAGFYRLVYPHPAGLDPVPSVAPEAEVLLALARMSADAAGNEALARALAVLEVSASVGAR